MEYVYRTQGTCSTNIELNVEDGVVKEVAFWGGCNGNLQGISRLVRGMKVEDVITKLEGVRCGGRPTSCPDQLCRALHEMGYSLIFIYVNYILICGLWQLVCRRSFFLQKVLISFSRVVLTQSFYNNVLIISVSSVSIGHLLIGRYFELKLILTRYL